MTAATPTLRPPVITECGPDCHVVIGRLKGLSPIARNRFDDLLGKPLAPFALAVILATGPDGLIYQRGGECFISNGQRLEPFDPTRADWTNEKQAAPAPEMTALEWAKELIQVQKMALDWDLHYSKGDRHKA